MCNKWRVDPVPVSVNTSGKIKVKYTLSRVIDEDGNKETRLDQYDTYIEAQRVADYLNRKE